MDGLKDDRLWKQSLEQAFDQGDLQAARSIVFSWLQAYRDNLLESPSRSVWRAPELFAALADVVERTSDQFLIECLWQIFDPFCPCSMDGARIPLLGVPVLNRIDLLGKLLQSLDVDIETLAIVDNSGGDPEVISFLRDLLAEGHPRVRRIELAHNFRNAGVAASWNQILRAFPEAPAALIVNDDVVFSPGILARLHSLLDVSRAQFVPLLPGPDAFSAFAITVKTWDRIGLFDESFYPAYFEDLEYRDRLRADPEVQWIEDPAIQAEMAQVNPSRSSTISADRRLQEFNKTSFSINRLWYFSHRRLQNDRRGQWIRRWISAWQP